MELDRLINKKQ